MIHQGGRGTEAGFTGFRPAAFGFLRDLAANNDKAWFEANRPTYEAEIRAPCIALVLDVSAELARRDLPLAGDAKRSLFRIHRDVRFSRDKRPYKTETGIMWGRQGAGRSFAGVLYFHLSPHGCFAAAAFHMPDPDTLDAIREAIRVRPDIFLGVRNTLVEQGLTLSNDSAMARMPRGFEDLRGSPVADAIRLRSFSVQRPVADDVARSPALAGLIADLAADALPLLRFGWGAIDEVRGSVIA